MPEAVLLRFLQVQKQRACRFRAGGIILQAERFDARDLEVLLQDLIRSRFLIVLSGQAVHDGAEPSCNLFGIRAADEEGVVADDL